MRGVSYGWAVPAVAQGLRGVGVFAAYAVATAVSCFAVASGIDRLASTLIAAHSVTPPVLPPVLTATSKREPAAMYVVRTAHVVPTNDEWADKLRDPAFWSKMKSGKQSASWTKPQVETSARSNLGNPPTRFDSSSPFASQRSKPSKPADSDSDDATFRTVCVRTCDGAFFPLSFATTRDKLEQDAGRCEKSCGSEARMFFHRNPGGEAEDMEDLDGRPYKRLPNAFLYKTKYVEACKCRPHPWEDASLTRHKVYALEAQQAKGDKVAASELKDIRAKMKQAEVDAAAEKVRAAQALAAEQKRVAAEAKAEKARIRMTSAQERSGKAQIDKAQVETGSVATSGPPLSLVPQGAQPVAGDLRTPRVSAKKSYPPPVRASGPAAVIALETVAPGVVLMRLGASSTYVRASNQSRPGAVR